MQNTGEESTFETLIPSGKTPLLLKSCEIKLKSSNSDKSIGFGSFFLRLRVQVIDKRKDSNKRKWREDKNLAYLLENFESFS